MINSSALAYNFMRHIKNSPHIRTHLFVLQRLLNKLIKDAEEDFNGEEKTFYDIEEISYYKKLICFIGKEDLLCSNYLISTKEPQDFIKHFEIINAEFKKEFNELSYITSMKVERPAYKNDHNFIIVEYNELFFNSMQKGTRHNNLISTVSFLILRILD